jgi:hypothetical protein
VVTDRKVYKIKIMVLTMTTIFGLTHEKVNAGVLVADRQTTAIGENGLPSGKHLGRKLWKSSDEYSCFGHMGNRNGETEELAYNMSSGKIDIEKITKKGYFPELRKLNIKRMGKTMPNPDQMSGIILATRYEDTPKIYTCFPLGAVEERMWTCAGSGDQKIQEYMNALATMSEARNYLEEAGGPETEDLIRIGLEAVRRAQSQDIYSQGLDMLVCTADGIKDHRSDLGDNFGNTLKKIQEQYKVDKKE